MNKYLLSFEASKRMKRNTYYIILSIIIIIGFLFLNHMMETSIKDHELESMNFSIEEVNRIIRELPDFNLSEEKLEIALIEEKNELQLLQKKLQFIKEDNWRDAIAIDLQLDEAFLQGIESGRLGGGEPIEIVQYRMALNKELLDKGIKPAIELYSTQGFNFLKRVGELFYGYAGIIFILFLIGDIFSKEFERGTIKLLFAQPISRITVLNAKFIISLISSIFILLIITIVAFTSGSILSETGSIHYPVPRYGNPIGFMKLGQQLLQSGLLLLFVLIFIITFTFMIAIISRNSIITISFTIILTGLFGFGITNYHFLSGIAHLIPFTYIDTMSVVNGKLAFETDNPNINLRNGLMITMLVGIVLYVINIFMIQRKDIL